MTNKSDEEQAVEVLLSLTAESDPILTELWSNEKDAAYDKILTDE
jgi:hypothetical protein